jgi:hypothetical protein
MDREELWRRAYVGNRLRMDMWGAMWMAYICVVGVFVIAFTGVWVENFWGSAPPALIYAVAAFAFTHRYNLLLVSLVEHEMSQF